MATKFIIGVMGPGENATPDENELAHNLGGAIAKQGWITLTGGRAFGVMDAALKGAAEEGGFTIGVVPGDSEKGSSPHASIKVITGMGGARNSINVLSSHVIVVCGMSAGTASEVALAIKADKRIILLNLDEISIQFFKKVGTYKITLAKTVEETIV
ncbi:MAG TPA: hypothetical protein VK517_01760, partial [Cyclobacteriaceae bacterium]|nr:hypothetical protein [Cyclobacteriaceae bacterium]